MIPIFGSEFPSLGSTISSTFGLLAVLVLTGCAAPMPRAAQPASAPAVPVAQPTAPPAEPTDPPAAVTTPPSAAPATKLSFHKALEGVTSIEEALEKVQQALGERGFGIITEIDVQAVMKKKLDVDMKPFWILGACNPQKAHRAISADPEMGLLLPCKVIVYESEAGEYVVAFARPKAIFSLVERPELAPLAEEVEAAMRQAFDAL